MPLVAKLKRSIIDMFVATGQNVCGTIPFPECPPAPLGRTIAYKFSNVRGQKGTCDLMVRNGQEYFSKEARRDLPILTPNNSNRTTNSASQPSPLDDTEAPLLVSAASLFEQELEGVLVSPQDRVEIL